MQGILAVYLFIIGAAFGSFAGAMVWRIKNRRDVLRERSECEHCHHVLAVKDLLPVVSWLALKGRCRYCHKPIGWEAFLLEVGLATIFALTYLWWPYSLSSGFDWTILILWLGALVGLTILFVYDLKWFLLPDVIVWPLAALGLVLFLLRVFSLHLTPTIAVEEFVLALLPITGIYGLLYIVSKGAWVGLGDVKLGLFIGLALGWQAALVAFMLANLIGTAVILPALVGGKLKRTAHIPFGPLLILGTWLALLFGQRLLDAYLGSLGV